MKNHSKVRCRTFQLRRGPPRSSPSRARARGNTPRGKPPLAIRSPASETWAPISDLELCLFPFPGIRFRFPFSPYRSFSLFPGEKGKRFLLNAFSSNFQKKINAAFWENPEKIWSTFRKIQQNSAKIQQHPGKLANFCKNQQTIQQFLTKKLRLENGAKECSV